MIKTALLISIIHVMYYTYIGLVYQILKVGTITNTPNDEVFRLRSKYNVKINTFQKSSGHLGFSWLNTIYLNERLFKVKKKARDPYRALRWTFYHEYYHLKYHTWKVFGMRLVLSFLPMLVLLPVHRTIAFIVTVVVYALFAFFMGKVIDKVFEKQADEYANKMIKDE